MYILTSSIRQADQHSQFFFSLLLGTFLESIFRLLLPLVVPSPSMSFSLMGLPMAVNIQVMLRLSLALHSTNSTPYFLARAAPSAKLTCRSLSLQSTLLPTITLLMDSGWDSLICLIQFSRFWKDFLSVTEQTKMTPAAPLQYVSVMVLKRSWPAVSQICILILTPSMLMVLILKSTPMVVMWVILYSSLTQRSRMLVLPTAVSPIITSFTRQSYLSSSRRLVISIVLQLNSKKSPPTHHTPENNKYQIFTILSCFCLARGPTFAKDSPFTVCLRNSVGDMGLFLDEDSGNCLAFRLTWKIESLSAFSLMTSGSYYSLESFWGVKKLLLSWGATVLTLALKLALRSLIVNLECFLSGSWSSSESARTCRELNLALRW